MDYEIHRIDNVTGQDVLVQTITDQSQTSFTHVTGLGMPPKWCYYMLAHFDCPGFTSAHSDTICYEPNPATPEILSAGVLPDNRGVLTWKPSRSPQTKGYIIYSYLPNGGIVPLDTVYGRFTTSWIDNLQNPTTNPLGYTISAIDLCPGHQPSAFNQSPHRTMRLTERTSTCERSIALNWTRYINFPQGVKEYRIYANVNNSGYQLVGSVDSSSLSFNFSQFNDGDSLQLQVVAISTADTTIQPSSNYLYLRASIVQPPRYIYLTRLSVETDNTISLRWITDPLAEIFLYQIQHTTDCNNYQLVKQVNAQFPLPTIENAVDTTVIPNETSYCYNVVALDSCNGKKSSPHGKTIFLTADLTDYYEVKLDWNAYEIYGATVLRYKLYRNIGTGYSLLRTFAPDIRTFKDSVYNFLDEKGKFCYRLEADYEIHLPDANYHDTLNSFSNTACVDHRPIIYVPNAFVPNGVNNVFKPRIIFGEPSNYSLKIFNRYGGKIFESNDPNTGWNGTDSGKQVQQGGYAYLITFTAADGTLVERKGIVLLISK